MEEEYCPTIEEAIYDADYSELYALFDKLKIDTDFDAGEMLKALFLTGEYGGSYSARIAKAGEEPALWISLDRRIGNSQVSDFFVIEIYQFINGSPESLYYKNIGFLGDNTERVYEPYDLIYQWLENTYLSKEK